MEALAILGVGHGVQKIFVAADPGRTRKSTLSLLRTSFAAERASVCSSSILTTQVELKVQMCFSRNSITRSSGNTNVPLDNMTLAYKERSVVDSAGFLRREQHFSETEAFNADCEEVFV